MKQVNESRSQAEKAEREWAKGIPCGCPECRAERGLTMYGEVRQ